MFKVKVTYKSKVTGRDLVTYVGQRGETKRDQNKVVGWAKKSSAEKYLEGKNYYQAYDGVECEIIEA